MSIVQINMRLCETHRVGVKTREQIVSAVSCPALSLYGILLTGLSETGDDFCFIRPQPRTRQLLYGISGIGEVLIGDAWVPCPAGSVYATPAHVFHGYRAMPDARWRIGWVAYRANWPEGPLAGMTHPALAAIDPRPLTDAIGGLYRESLGEKDPGIMEHGAYLIHRHARRVIGVGTPRDVLGSLWERVDTQPAYPWTVTALAEIAGMSGEHLRRLCLQKIGRSPMRQVTHLRMRRAAALLSMHSYTIETIAQSVGYDNPFAFSVAFKREMGMPPSAYRATAL